MGNCSSGSLPLGRPEKRGAVVSRAALSCIPFRWSEALSPPRWGAVSTATWTKPALQGRLYLPGAPQWVPINVCWMSGLKPCRVPQREMQTRNSHRASRVRILSSVIHSSKHWKLYTSINWWMNTHNAEYPPNGILSSQKKNALTLALTWTNPEDMMINERSQLRRSPYVCEISVIGQS